MQTDVGVYMKRIFLALSFLLFTIHSFGQKFSQYNTGTLYDSFENVSQKSYTPDSSRKYAFNFFIPNFSTSLYITGNSQAPLKSRAFLGYYNTSDLQIGQGKFNRNGTSINSYFIMFKIFSSLDGNSELGFSAQTRGELRGVFSDESVALYNGAGAFPADHYDNAFNNSATLLAYHQFSFSYREQISQKFALGVKLSLLSGLQYQKINVNSSSIDIDRLNDRADLTMQGKYYLSYTPGSFNGHDLLPTLRNPGASITLGTSLQTRDNFILQFNVKDLGFIHWSKRSAIYNFAATRPIENLSTNQREHNIYDAAKNITHTNGIETSYVTPTYGKVELSANKNYWFDYDKRYRYAPTFIVSKEVFYPGFAAALVNPVSYNNYTLSLTTAYDNYKIFSLGGQFMIKSPNAEFFIGSERLLATGSAILASAKSNTEINRRSAYSGMDIFLGATFKFGPVIEHPMNASYVPLDYSPGFFTRLFNKIFNSPDNY